MFTKFHTGDLIYKKNMKFKKQENKMNELELKTNCYKTTFTGLEIIGQSTKDDWENYGNVLKKIDEAKQWAIGDWLCDGKKHYGDGLYEKASNILGLEIKYLQNIKQVADKYEFTHRCVNLSYAHHFELISIKKIIENKHSKLELSDEIDMDKIQEFLNKAEKEKLSVRELRQLVSEYKREQQEIIRLANEPEKYNIIYADPPWEYNDKQNTEMLGGAEKHYKTMSIQEICNLPIKNISSENCVLFIWTTAPLLEDVFKVISAWGFKYKAEFIWDKVKHNMGHYNSVRHENLLIATKGSYTPENIKLYDSVQVIEKTDKHSEKPIEFLNIIDDIYPSGKRIELFARKKQKENWETWGNEV